MYTVYCHISPSEKMYFGITMNDVKRRWMGGYGYKKCPRFASAIKKYGWDNFQHIILKEGLTKEEAENEEIRLIKEFKTNDPDYGYNIENGGNTSGTHSEETKRLISQKIKGRIVSKESIEKRKQTIKNHGGCSGELNSFYGKHHSEETKQKQSDFMKGNQYNKGNHHSDEFKAYKSQQMKEKYKDGSPVQKEVLCIDAEGNIVGRYRSMRFAAESIGMSASSLCRRIKNNQPSNGFYWRYA